MVIQLTAAQAHLLEELLEQHQTVMHGNLAAIAALPELAEVQNEGEGYMAAQIDLAESILAELRP